MKTSKRRFSDWPYLKPGEKYASNCANKLPTEKGLEVKQRDPIREAAEKQDAMDLILNSRMCQSGDFFSARDASQICKRDSEYTRRLLNDMALAGQLSRVALNGSKYSYRRISDVLDFHKHSDWRKDHAVYDLIANEQYETLIAECEAMT